MDEEQWDDMAIIRAFEAALSEKKTKKEQSKKATPSKSEQKPIASANLGSNSSRQSSTASVPKSPSGSSLNDRKSQYHHGYSDEIYKQAYAQAYAQLQAQIQQQHQQYYPTTNIHSPTYPTSPMYGTTIPSLPMPSLHSSFPSMGGGGIQMEAPGQSADLANVLLSWYQSGYYTGRYQALQEMQQKAGTGQRQAGYPMGPNTTTPTTAASPQYPQFPQYSFHPPPAPSSYR